MREIHLTEPKIVNYSIFDLDQFDEHDIIENVRSGYKHAPTKYCGNKHESLDFILPKLPYLDTWVDVFGGSGEVTFNRKRSKLEVYNDRQSGMSCFYRCLQDTMLLDEFTKRLEYLQHSRELFYAFKEDLNAPPDSSQASLTTVDRALKWYYCVQVSFAGKGIEFGRVKKPDTPIYNKIHAYIGDFWHFHERLKGVQIENLDWKDCITDYDSHSTVFYLDPPYWDSNQYVHTMNKADHRRMCDMIFASKGFFALSGYENSLYDEYPWDTVHVTTVKENFTPSEFTHKSRSSVRKEFLWVKEAT